MTDPLVSVICLCYNQQRFVQETIHSVLNQTYKNIELIIVDDASTDSSVQKIGKAILNYSRVQFLPLTNNIGNCRAFNKGLAQSKGEFVIDLAADDILLSDRIEKGVHALQQAGPSYGVNFSDAEWIDEAGEFLYLHSKRFPHDTIPQGNIYKNLIEQFFICSPTVMFRKEVIDYLSGYDETLSYEDFDFWIRSSRKFMYCYTPEVLIKKRIVKRSLSEKQFQFFSPHAQSTLKVCEKIMNLNTSNEEQRALDKRLRYEFLLTFRLLNIPVAFGFLQLIYRNKKLNYQ